MPEQEQPMGLGALFLEAMFKKYDDISSTIKTSTIPQFTKFVKNVVLTLLVVFIGSLILVAMGTTSEVKILTVLGRFGLIFTGVLFFFAAAPIGFVFAGHKYVTFIRSFAIYQLFITLVIWISPMPVSASLLFGLSFASGLLAFANILESNPGIVRLCTTVVFAGLLAATYFPSFRDKFDSQIIGMNEPSLIQIHTGDLKAGKIQFFLKGQPKVWYLTTVEGTYELFDHSGYHDIYQKELQPITLEIVRKLINDENLLSPRNLQRSSTTTATESVNDSHRQTQAQQQPQRIAKPVADIVFFDSLTGQPRVWVSKSNQGCFDMFDNRGINPQTGEELHPVNTEIIRSIKECSSKALAESARIALQAKETQEKQEAQTIESQRLVALKSLINCNARATTAIGIKPTSHTSGTETSTAVAEQLASTAKASSVSVASNFFRPQFFSEGYFERAYGGDVKPLQEAGAFACINTVWLGQLESSCGQVVNGVITCDLRLTYRVVDRTGRTLDSGSVAATGPGFDKLEALQNGARTLIESKSSQILRSLNGG